MITGGKDKLCGSLKSSDLFAIHNIPYPPNFSSTDVSKIKLAIRDSTCAFGFKDVVHRRVFFSANAIMHASHR